MPSGSAARERKSGESDELTMPPQTLNTLRMLVYTTHVMASSFSWLTQGKEGLHLESQLQYIVLQCYNDYVIIFITPTTMWVTQGQQPGNSSLK